MEPIETQIASYDLLHRLSGAIEVRCREDSPIFKRLSLVAEERGNRHGTTTASRTDPHQAGMSGPKAYRTICEENCGCFLPHGRRLARACRWPIWAGLSGRDRGRIRRGVTTTSMRRLEF